MINLYEFVHFTFYLGHGPLVSTPLSRSLQRRRRLPPATLSHHHHHRLSWSLGGSTPEHNSSGQQIANRQMASRQRWSLHLEDDSTHRSSFSSPIPPNEATTPSQSRERLSPGMPSLSGPWSLPHRRRDAVQSSTEIFRNSPGTLRSSPAMQERRTSWCRGGDDVISPVTSSVSTAAPQQAVLAELHTSTLIEHGDDPGCVLSLESSRARTLSR
jgi:hypothetical protein